jgi:hypothetical protein
VTSAWGESTEIRNARSTARSNVAERGDPRPVSLWRSRTRPPFTPTSLRKSDPDNWFDSDAYWIVKPLDLSPRPWTSVLFATGRNDRRTDSPRHLLDLMSPRPTSMSLSANSTRAAPGARLWRPTGFEPADAMSIRISAPLPAPRHPGAFARESCAFARESCTQTNGPSSLTVRSAAQLRRMRRDVYQR